MTTILSAQERDVALRFLGAIQPALSREERVELRCLAPGQKPIQRFYTGPDTLLGDVERYAPSHNVYVGVALRRGGGEARHITRAGCLWAELDFKLYPGVDPAAEALAAVACFPWRPSVLLHSGGGLQLYWRLTAPADLTTPERRQRFEAVNKALAHALCGRERKPDYVHDVARILRLPGTLNYKYTPPRSVTLRWCESGQRYALDALEQGVGVRFPWAMRPDQPHAGQQAAWQPATEPPTDLREWAAQGRIKRTTLDLLDEAGPAGYQSASEADAALAAGLISAGLTTGEAYVLLLCSVRGDDALTRKGERHGETYLKRTVHRAAGFVGPVVERPTGLRVRYSTPAQTRQALVRDGRR